MWSLSLITAAAAEPIDLATEVKQQLRLEDFEIAAQSSVLAAYIGSARQACEAFTGRQLINATWELWLDSWYEDGIYRCADGVERLRLPKAPLGSVTSIKYIDTSGVEQTWASTEYSVIAPAGETAQRGSVGLGFEKSFPTHRQQAAAIKVRFVAGYGASYAAVPKALKAGMLMVDAELFERREMATNGTQSANQASAEVLWWPFRA